MKKSEQDILIDAVEDIIAQAEDLSYALHSNELDKPDRSKLKDILKVIKANLNDCLNIAREVHADSNA